VDDQRLLDELLRVAGRLGVAVRTERFETPAAAGGAACLLRGERLVLLDERAPLRDRVAALARALSEAETDVVFMLPEAREALEAARGPGSGRSGAAVRALAPGGLRAPHPRC
jgi:hypothetical protein